MTGVPNTLPLQDLNRNAELGRVGRVLTPPHRGADSSRSVEEQDQVL